MLSRHFLRTKALQAIYAYKTTEQFSTSVDIEKSFKQNVVSLNVLGIVQLSTLLELKDVVERVLDDAQHKFRPTAEELNPNRRFVENLFLTSLANNFEMRKYRDNLPVNWDLHTDVFRKFYNNLKTTALYKDYMEDKDFTFESDKKFVSELFRCLVNDSALRDIIFDKELLWEDDFDQVAQYNFMMIKAIEEVDFNEAFHISLMYDEHVEKDRDDFNFARQLILETIKHIEDNESLIRDHLNNWEFERVALMDVLLINMAIAEFTSCPSIPERVTVDEYIELSKEFSTDKSKLFINGILEKILIDLRVAGRINKSGRGLYDPDFEDSEEQ